MNTTPNGHLPTGTHRESVVSRRDLIGRVALGASAATFLGPHLARADAATPVVTPTPEAPVPSFGVVYGEAGGEQLLLDAYPLPPRAAPRPAIILIHGGYLAYGSRSDVAFLAPVYMDFGCVVFTIDYRLVDPASGHNAWPAQLDDAQRAVRWVRAHAADYNIDPARIGVWGHSSGGQLAAFLGVTDTRDNSDPALAAYSSRATCVIDAAGDADVTIPYTDPEATRINTPLYGGILEAVPDNYRAASARYHVDGRAAPFLILHGLADTSVPLAMSWNLAQTLHENGVEVVFAQLVGVDHGFSSGAELVVPLAQGFVARHLTPER